MKKLSLQHQSENVEAQFCSSDSLDGQCQDRAYFSITVLLGKRKSLNDGVAINPLPMTMPTSLIQCTIHADKK
jgi:hypothetical protein